MPVPAEARAINPLPTGSEVPEGVLGALILGALIGELRLAAAPWERRRPFISSAVPAGRRPSFTGRSRPPAE